MWKTDHKNFWAPQAASAFWKERRNNFKSTFKSLVLPLHVLIAAAHFICNLALSSSQAFFPTQIRFQEKTRSLLCLQIAGSNSTVSNQAFLWTQTAWKKGGHGQCSSQAPLGATAGTLQQTYWQPRFALHTGKRRSVLDFSSVSGS